MYSDLYYSIRHMHDSSCRHALLPEETVTSAGVPPSWPGSKECRGLAACVRVGAEEEEKEKNFFGRLCDAINSNDPLSAVEDDGDVRDMHEAAEVFEERTEDVFSYLQVRRTLHLPARSLQSASVPAFLNVLVLVHVLHDRCG